MTANQGDRRQVAVRADEAIARQLAEEQYRRSQARAVDVDDLPAVEVTVLHLNGEVVISGALEAVEAWADAEWFRTGADLAIARQWRDPRNSSITRFWGAVDDFFFGDEAAAGRAHVAAQWNRAYLEHVKRRYR